MTDRPDYDALQIEMTTKLLKKSERWQNILSRYFPPTIKRAGPIDMSDWNPEDHIMVGEWRTYRRAIMPNVLGRYIDTLDTETK